MAGEHSETSRRDVLKYTGAGAGAAALAGCKTRPTPTPGPGDGLGSQTFKIGVLAPSPGSFAPGTSAVRSAKLAATEINKNGGIAGADVEILVGDTETSPSTAKEEYVRLMREENCDVAICADLLDQVVLGLFPPMKSTQKLLITTGAIGPELAGYVHSRYDEFKYHFRVGPINAFDLAKAQLELLDTYNQDLMGWESAAVLVENLGPLDPFFKRLKGKIEEYLDVKMYKRTSSGITNWTPVYDEVENADVDVAMSFLALTSTAAVKQWYTQKRPFELGGILLYDQLYSFWENVNGACRYSFTMNAVTPQTTNTEQTQPFMKRYRERYTPKDASVPSYPVYTGPITYDSINVLRTAIEDFVADNEARKPTGDELVPYMEDVRYTNGVSLQEFQFTPKSATYAHDPQWPSMKETGVPVWQQWQKDPEIIENYGVMHSFAPEQNKTSGYKVPHWIDRELP